MAVIKTNLVCDLQSPVKVQYLDGVLFSQDNQANQINVAVYDNGEPAVISGTVTANVIRSDGGTVAVSGGSLSGNVASIALPSAAYYIPGVISVIIKITDSSVITTIAAIVANVYRSSTDSAVDPGTIIPSVQTLISSIETAVASIPADYSSLWTCLAPAFSSSASYTAGQYVTYDGGLYRFTATHSGSWSAGDVAAVNIGGEIAGIRKDLSMSDEKAMSFIAEKFGPREYVDWQDGAIKTSDSTIDVNKIVFPGTGKWKHLVIPCTAGASFSINIGSANSTYRPWAWVASNGDRLGVASVNAVNTSLLAPESAAYLVCNVRYDNNSVYTLRSGSNQLANIANLAESVMCANPTSHGTLTVGEAINTSNGKNVSNAKYARTDIILAEGRRNAVRLTDSNYFCKVSYYDDTGSLDGTGYIDCSEYIKGTVFLPPYAKKFAVSFRRTDGADMTSADSTAILAALDFAASTDVTFTNSLIAADAKATGDWINENISGVYDEFGKKWYLFKRGGAISTSSATIDKDAIIKNILWYYCVVPCVEGDVFHLVVTSANSSYRPWAFIAADGTRLSVASVNAVNTNITAPENAAYLICNSNSLTGLKLTSGTSEDNVVDTDSLNEYGYTRDLLGIFMTIGVVGDSLASGQGRINDLNHFHDFYEYSWPQQMKRRLGNEVYNFTESSMTTRSWLTDADHGWPLASDGNHKCQAYIIGLGANDISIIENNPSYLGSESDVHVDDYTQNPDTYYGNYARIISMLRTLEPRSIIFVLTNPSYGASSIRAQCNVAVEYMATAFDGVYCVPIDASLFNSGYISANKVKSHYTPGAYLYIANYLMQAMSKIIYDHPSDFFFVNLIGTNYETPVIS